MFLTSCGLIALGLLLMLVGLASLPLMGWGGAYVFAVGMWVLGAAAPPATLWLVGAVAYRRKYGRWYLGNART